MATTNTSKVRIVMRTATLAGLGLLTAFWAGLLLYCSVAFSKRGTSGVTDALTHLISNPFEAQSPSSTAMIGVLCGYGMLTVLLVLAYWRLFAHRGASGRHRT